MLKIKVLNVDSFCSSDFQFVGIFTLSTRKMTHGYAILKFIFQKNCLIASATQSKYSSSTHAVSYKLTSTKPNFSRLLKLPPEFEGFDRKLNFPVFENEKFYGIKTWNTFGEGIKVLDKNMNLIWEKQAPENFGQFVTECRWYKFRYLSAYMSKNYRYLILIMGAPIDLGPYFKGKEIYKASPSGYKRTGCIKYTTSCEMLYIDEEEERFYSVGEYPDEQLAEKKNTLF